MSNYKQNKEKAKHRNTDPTETDQAGARDTDINVIVGRFVNTGMAPGAPHEPMFGDFSNLPTGLQDFIHASRELGNIKAQLPIELREKRTEDILALTPAELTTILTPPTPKTPKEGEA